MKSTKLGGRVAIVTGGASGIGRATAERLAAEGAAVAVLDRDEAGAAAVAASLPEAIAIKVDVSDEAGIQAAIEAVVARFRGIDMVVNNAGGNLFPVGPFWEAPLDQIRTITDVNYLSQIICLKATLPFLRASNAASVVNIASGSGIRTVKGMQAYGSAKAAVINLTQAAASELGQFGIRVNAIAPGYIRFKTQKASFSPKQAAAIEEAALQAQALKQVGEPEDIAAAVAFLCSQDARHITGIVLPVAGGS